MSHPSKSEARAHGSHEKRPVSARKPSHGVPFIVLILALIFGFVGYFVAYFLPEHHSMHLPAAGAGWFFGVLMGYLWYFTRGDAGLF